MLLESQENFSKNGARPVQILGRPNRSTEFLACKTGRGTPAWATGCPVSFVLLRLAEFVFQAPPFTQRCAGEGELVFGLTKHGVTLPSARGTVKQALFAFFQPGFGTEGAV